ncbi:hypothetical protein ACJJTC_014056 [Scirpophaga incertulas]
MNRVLDLYITNVDTSICAPPSIPLVPVDPLHPPFYTFANFSMPCKPLPISSTPRYRFHEANYDNIKIAIEDVEWGSILNNKSAEQCFNQQSSTTFLLHSSRCGQDTFSRQSIGLVSLLDRQWENHLLGTLHDVLNPFTFPLPTIALGLLAMVILTYIY